MKKLYKPHTNRVLYGICSGIGKYFKIDPVLVRLLFRIRIFANGLGLLLYIAGIVIILENPIEVRNRVV